MWHRFFTLIYGILFVGITIFIPIHFFINSNNSDYQHTKYKIKCNKNGEYVVLQGNNLDEHWQTTYLLIGKYGYEKEFRVHCEYYEQLTKYIIDYKNTSSGLEAGKIQNEYFNFKNEKLIFTSYLLKNYTLEKQKNKEYWEYVFIYPAIDAITLGLGLLIVLQIFKAFYTYIVFGQATLHPFRARKQKKVSKKEK